MTGKDVKEVGYQVNHGRSAIIRIPEVDALEGVRIIAETLAKDAGAWQDVTPYLARAGHLDVFNNLGDAPKALVIENHRRVAQFPEKLEAALQVLGALKRQAPHVYNASVIYPPGKCVIIANKEGQKQLANCHEQLADLAVGSYAFSRS